MCQRVLHSNMARLNLTGVDEGLSVVVSSVIVGADDPELVMDSILKIFPAVSYTHLTLPTIYSV